MNNVTDSLIIGMTYKDVETFYSN